MNNKKFIINNKKITFEEINNKKTIINIKRNIKSNFNYYILDIINLKSGNYSQTIHDDNDNTNIYNCVYFSYKIYNYYDRIKFKHDLGKQ